MTGRSRAAGPEAGQPGRDHVAHVRLSEPEWRRLQAAAASAGYGRVATWMRTTLLAASAIHDEDAGGGADAGWGGDARVRVELLLAEELRGLRVELRRHGANLNQLAKAANIAAAGGGDFPAVERIEAAVAAEMELLDEWLQRWGVAS